MNNIRRLRKRAGLTQAELSRRCNISQGALSGYETGKYEPDNTTLLRMADIFNVSVDEILGRNTQEQRTASSMATQDEHEALSPALPKTAEARILSAGVDRMPAKDRERALHMMRLMFEQYEEFFREDDNDT